MHLGIFSYNVEYGARPDALARACEERGFESFWVGEHTHIPASQRPPIRVASHCQGLTITWRTPSCR